MAQVTYCRYSGGVGFMEIFYYISAHVKVYVGVDRRMGQPEITQILYWCS